MNGLQAYRYYMAVKLHFTKDSFNVFETPSVKCSVATFEKRNDRYLFEKLAKKYNTDRDIIQYYVANFAYGHEDVVYEEEESKTIYRKWISKKESITKVLDDDCSIILNEMEKNSIDKARLLYLTNGYQPYILTLLISGKVSIESIRILDDYLDFVSEWNGNATLQFWQNDLRRIRKLKRFVKYDKERIGRIIDNFQFELNELSSHSS